MLLLLERILGFLKKYRFVFIPALILAIAMTIYMFATTPKTYSSRLVAHSVVMTNQEHIEIINNWNRLLKQHEYSSLAKIFNLPESHIVKLRKITGTEIQKIFSAANPNGFYIDVDVTDNSFLPELQTGIVNGFENAGYAQERLSYKRNRVRELIGKLQQEIGKLDSTKRDMENIISGKEKASASVIVDISTVTRQLIEMNDRLYQLQEELNFTTGLQVLQGFATFSKPTNPKLLVLLAINLIFFMALAFFIAFTIHITRKLKQRSKLSVTQHAER